jgi:hypothetical protein
MSVREEAPVQEKAEEPRPKTRGEVYEGIAFTFCKAATIILLTNKFALPVAAGLAAVFYILAEVHGKSDTRCILRSPILIATFWGAVALVSLFAILRPMFFH